MGKEKRDKMGKNFNPFNYLCTLPGAEDRNLISKQFYTMLVKFGLAFMYDHNLDVIDDSPVLTSAERSAGPTEERQTSNPKTVVIIGAGIAGLAAAYELKRAGHKVIIAERQERVAGRIKTLRFQFDQKGLSGEAGAMRIPIKNRHYLTDAYVDKFRLEKTPFFNNDPAGNCFYKVQGETVRISDFQGDAGPAAKKRAKALCNKLWPGWDEKIKNRVPEINDILEYFHLTMKEVEEDAPPPFKPGDDVEEYTEQWQRWMMRWSSLSLLDYLRSDIGLKEKSQTPLRPWPKEAIHGLCVLNYMPTIYSSVATAMAEEVGEWWTPKMYTLKNGMEQLPEAFVRHGIPFSLEEDIQYGLTVKKVEWKRKGDKPVRVSGRQTRTGNEFHFDADATIVTLPLNIVRHMEFEPFFPQHINDAIAGINYMPSTKIFLGFRERFWKNTDFPVQNGGISKTNLPISQIVYPKNIEDTDRGVLMIYTWGKEALLFGSQSEDQAITEALEEVQTVYKDLFPKGHSSSKVTDCFEVGAVQAWHNDSSAEGAFVQLLPHSYMLNLRSLLDPTEIRPVYIGGEATSFANGWIQGALESGLRAAWQFYKFNENWA